MDAMPVKVSLPSLSLHPNLRPRFAILNPLLRLKPPSCWSNYCRSARHVPKTKQHALKGSACREEVLRKRMCVSHWELGGGAAHIRMHEPRESENKH